MSRHAFTQLDVFTDQPFCGNPLAVFPEGEGISDEDQMKIAREMNLSETVFVLPPKPKASPDGPDVLRRLRIYTPAREIPFAGHPVVGTWNMLARAGVVPVPEGGTGWTRIHHEVGIGVLPVDIEFKDGAPVQVMMTQGKLQIVNEIDDGQEQAELARALGRAREDLDETLPIQVITTGLTCLAVPMRSLADLRDCRVNSSLLGEIYTRRGAVGCLVFSRETLEVGDSRACARFFAPADNIAEDPATGSACGALGGYLIHHSALQLEPQDGKYKFVIEQGDFINRPSRIRLEVSGGPGDVREVRVGGPSVVVARGEVEY
ncbi:MAG TPA: PhzF family phenazine biosynthesis protein [Pyrinomonadaceae bacterium]